MYKNVFEESMIEGAPPKTTSAPLSKPIAAPAASGFEPVGEQEMFFDESEPIATSPTAATR